MTNAENLEETTLDTIDAAVEVAEDAIEEAVSHVKELLKGKVVKLGLAGALVDIGKEVPALLHISQIPRSEGHENTNNIQDLLETGQDVDVWVRKAKDNRIEVTMIKPLDLEWREIKKDMTVRGTVIRLEKFGAFVEIGAERPGLVHISEMAHSYVRQPSDVLKEGDEIETQVLEVNRRKKQIKLSMKALQPVPEVTEEAPRSEYENSRSTTSRPSVARPASARAQQLKEGRVSEPKDKTQRKPRKTNKKRDEINTGEVSFMFTNSGSESEPTAMEIKLREAMEKAQSRKQQGEDKRKKSSSIEQDDILSRTLINKIG